MAKRCTATACERVETGWYMLVQKLQSTGWGWCASVRWVPKGATICRCSASEAYHKISSTAFQKLHPAEKTFYNELFDPQSTDGNYYLPKDPHVLHMVCFINHSPTPSCTYDETHHSMVTIRPLKTGDEITVDYSLYPEPHQYNRLYTR